MHDLIKNPIRRKLIMDFKSNHHGPDREVWQQNNKAAATAVYLSDIVWTNKYMNTDSKVKIYIFRIEIRSGTQKN